MKNSLRFETKRVEGFIQNVDEDAGIIEHIFAVFGNLDKGRDILHPGSFKKTIQERGDRVRVLDQHNTHTVLSVLGKPLEIRELTRDELPQKMISQFPDVTGGVYAKTQFFLDTPEGQGAFVRLKRGGIDEWSFGFDAVDYQIESDKKQNKNIRHIRQVRLWEYGPVIWGLNEATQTLGTKADDDLESKKVLITTDYPLAPLDYEYDEEAAIGRIAELSDFDAEVVYMFLTSEGDGLYPYLDIIDDQIAVVPAAIFDAAEELAGGLSDDDDSGMTDADLDEIVNAIERYYGKMRNVFEDESIVSPFGDESDDKAAPSEISLEDMVTWDSGGMTGRILEIIMDGVAEGQDGLSLEGTEDNPAYIIMVFADTGSGVEETDVLHVAYADDLTLTETTETAADPSRAEETKAHAHYEPTVQQVIDGWLMVTGSKLVARWLLFGVISRAEQIEIFNLLNNAAAVFDTGLDENMRDATAPGSYYDEYYDYWSMSPNLEEKGEQNKTLGNVLEGNIHVTLTQLFDRWIIQGHLTRAQRIALSGLIGNALNVITEGLGEDLDSRDVEGYVAYGDSFASHDPESETKAGRVLSSTNETKIKEAVETLVAVLESAGVLDSKAAFIHALAGNKVSKARDYIKALADIVGLSNEPGDSPNKQVGPIDPTTQDGPETDSTQGGEDEDLMSLIEAGQGELALLTLG